MKYEPGLLRRLGFEVFMPKVIPSTGFRSAAVDYEFDKSLSIPKRDLEVLNAFDFYLSPWTAEINAIVNRYFGTAFVMPHGSMLEQGARNFEGNLVLRAFGLQRPNTYGRVLEALHGALYLRKLQGIEHRFWFGEGYDNLHEVEPEFLQERALYLPIGMPEDYARKATRWRGGDHRILLLCPTIRTSEYYGEVYADFKKHFGDLPHVIMGVQDVEVDDPAVTGYVSDEVMDQMMATCAALYYPSEEPRHVHYSPIEAAISGLPVIFHAGSLLDRMTGGSMLGRVESVQHARALIAQLLAGDADLVTRITAEQARLPVLFSDSYCADLWRSQLSARKLLPHQQPASIVGTLGREAYRSAMMPFAQGRLRVDPHKYVTRPPRVNCNANEAKARWGGSLFDGIRFADEGLPRFIEYIDGIGAQEPHGRWSIQDKISVVLKHNVSGDFRLFIKAYGYRQNAGQTTTVRIGKSEQAFRLPTDAEDASGSWLHFSVAKATNVIEIDVPEPVMAVDSRNLGIALLEMRAAAPVALTAMESERLFGASLRQGIEFGGAMPAFVEGLQGIGMPEGQGRWSVADQVVIHLKHHLVGRVRLLFRAVGYGKNAEGPIAITVGDAVGTASFPSSHPPEEIAVDFDLPAPTSRISIKVPFPVAPPGDGRTIGINLVSLRAVLRDEQHTEPAREALGHRATVDAGA